MIEVAMAIVGAAVLIVLAMVIIERKRVEQQRVTVAALLAMAGDFAKGDGQ